MEPPLNPYEAPQLPLAHIAPADPGEFRPGELPCHHCGRPVPAGAKNCPACNALPLYDRVQLYFTAIPIFVVWVGAYAWQYFNRQTLPLVWLIAIALVVAIWFGMRALFNFLRNGKY